jgi:uncharacterized membrane protein YeiB
MSLTPYSAHVLVVAVGLLEDRKTAQYLILVTGCLTFAVLWRRGHDQGPLEKLVPTVWSRDRRAVLPRGRLPATTR